MKHRSWFLRFVLAAGLALVAADRAANAAQTTIAVHKCSVYACDSAASLKNEARLAFYSLPLGSIAFVSSQLYPLSAFVRICAGPRGGKDACLITAGDLGAVELDNQVYARAAKIAPIDIPASIAGSATNAIQELAEEWMFTSGTLVVTGRVGVNPWHDLLNPLTWVWMEILDTRTNQVQKVFVKDRITLRFPDGSTVEAEMQGPTAPSGHFFRFMFETIRLPNGEPYAYTPPPLPATPVASGIDLTPPWLASAFGGSLPYGVCAFLISHCEFISGSSVYDCYYRREPFRIDIRDWDALQQYLELK
jgi:hypothetical protein